MRRKWLTGIVCAAFITVIFGIAAQAAFEASVETAYNTAIQGLDALDGLDVSVTERTAAAQTNLSAVKDVTLQVCGIKTNSLKASIQVNTDESQSESYYYNNYYYTASSDGNIKREMDGSDAWQLINSHIYLDMTSNYLKMLCAETAEDGSTLYRFAATADTLGDYFQKLLQGASEGQGLVIDSLQGTMQTDKEGRIIQRTIQMVYTVTTGENQETFLMQSEAVFHQDKDPVQVTFPDLSGYKKLEPEKPVETITPLVRTVYVTADVNVRAAGDISAAILGGFYAGSGVTQTGYTSDGWIQVQYNETTGYIWGDYISTTKPVITKNGSGTMYATAEVNVRSTYSSEGTILGVLRKGQSVDITGTTNNNWIRVKYNGQTGYVYADYLSWSEPVVNTYVKNAYVSGTVTDASYGTITILRDDGQGTAVFNTTYASMNLKDTIYTGDWVEIFYYGTGAPYTASIVSDYTSPEESGKMQSYTAEGIVTSCTRNKLELSGSDGFYRMFDISEADIEMPQYPQVGQYVMVTWMSSTGGSETRNVPAMRVMG